MKLKGIGTLYKPTWRDPKTGRLRESPTWWIQYTANGKHTRETTRTTSRTEAVDFLKAKVRDAMSGIPTGPSVERTTFEDLATLILNDYDLNERRSLVRVKRSIGHLRRLLGKYRAKQITTDKVMAYSVARKHEGAANASINRELAALRRMFRLAHWAGTAANVPHVEMLAENNARKGFFERPEYEAVLRAAPDYLKPIITTAYITGWRVSSEILTRQRCHVDFRAGWLRLEPGETKNGRGRMFPLIPALRRTLEEQINRTKEFEKANSCIVPWLFHKNGRPLKSFKKAWTRACREAGISNRIPHDFRRTAVRNLERASVPRPSAMAAVGHETEAIYLRYAIVAESDLKDAGDRIASFLDADTDSRQVVYSG